MALDPVVNFFQSEIATLPVSDAGVTIVVSSGDGAKLPNPAVDGAFNLTIYKDGDPFASPEIVRVTARSTDTLTVTRAQEGSVATTKTAGSTWKVVMFPTAKTIQDIDSLKVNKAGDTMTGTLIVPTVTATNLGGTLSTASQPNVTSVGTLSSLTSSGTVTATKLVPTGNVTAGNGMYLPSANNLAFSTDSIERVRIDEKGRLLVGANSSDGGLENSIELSGVGINEFQPAYQVYAYTGTLPTNTGYLQFFRSRSSSVFGNTIVDNGDRLGMIRWLGANGTGYNASAEIYAEVDGTPGASNDMPGRIVFATTADGAGTSTERMRITASGVLELTQGQIKFPATAVASSDPNTLDDYEEGTFTPTLQDITGTITYSAQTGSYTKIGNVVNVKFRISLASYSATAGANPFVNLPFTSANVANAFNNSALFLENTTYVGQSFAWINPNTAVFYPASIDSGGVFTHITYLGYDSTTNITGNITYFV